METIFFCARFNAGERLTFRMPTDACGAVESSEIEASNIVLWTPAVVLRQQSFGMPTDELQTMQWIFWVQTYDVPLGLRTLKDKRKETHPWLHLNPCWLLTSNQGRIPSWDRRLYQRGTSISAKRLLLARLLRCHHTSPSCHVPSGEACNFQATGLMQYEAGVLGRKNLRER